MASIVIKVPEPAKGSFNHNRLAGKLLQAQILHLREALRKQNKDIAQLLAIDPKSLKTERDASNYIHKATAILHTQARKPSERPAK